jgi:hypothetical protein
VVAHKGRTSNTVKVPNSTFFTSYMYYIRSLFYLLIRFYCAQISYCFFNFKKWEDSSVMNVQLVLSGGQRP